MVACQEQVSSTTVDRTVTSMESPLRDTSATTIIIPAPDHVHAGFAGGNKDGIRRISLFNVNSHDAVPTIGLWDESCENIGDGESRYTLSTRFGS